MSIWIQVKDHLLIKIWWILYTHGSDPQPLVRLVRLQHDYFGTTIQHWFTKSCNTKTRFNHFCKIHYCILMYSPKCKVAYWYHQENIMYFWYHSLTLLISPIILQLMDYIDKFFTCSHHVAWLMGVRVSLITGLE